VRKLANWVKLTQAYPHASPSARLDIVVDLDAAVALAPRENGTRVYFPGSGNFFDVTETLDEIAAKCA
jgi:hypothetical protein